MSECEEQLDVVAIQRDEAEAKVKNLEVELAITQVNRGALQIRLDQALATIAAYEASVVDIYKKHPERIPGYALARATEALTILEECEQHGSPAYLVARDALKDMEAGPHSHPLKVALSIAYTTIQMAVVMLYHSHREDAVACFGEEGLQEALGAIKHLSIADVRVEDVYKEALDTLKTLVGK